MIKKLAFICFVFALLVGCGSKQQISFNQQSELNKEVRAASVHQIMNKKEKPSIVDNEERRNIKDIIKVMDGIDTVKQQIAHTIDENGWYQSMEEIVPTKQEFEVAIKPIVSPYFTDTFIQQVIINNMEAFFCYCDSPGPLRGSMKVDVEEGIQYDEDKVTFYAYLPSDGINTGAKYRVSTKNEQGQWKIDSIEAVLDSYQESFQLTPALIMAYYQLKGIELDYVDTITTNSFPDDLYLFHQTNGNKRIAVHSRDWYTIEAKELGKQSFYQ